MNHHRRHMEFHESGVFQVAKTASGHEVQGFFCPGPNIRAGGSEYRPTSSACAVAIRMADGTHIVMMRSSKTKAKASDVKKYKANPDAMSKGDPSLLDIFVNGVKQDWKQIGGSFTGSRGGSAVGSNVPKDQKGQAVGQSTFISRMHSTAGRGNNYESDVATAPTCVHVVDQKFAIDVSVPVIKSNDWDLVYEMSVTILASDSEDFGLCGDSNLIDEINAKDDNGKKKGYLNAGSNRGRPASTDFLFTSVQLAELYDTCGMSTAGGLKLFQGKAKENLCGSTGYNIDDAEADCQAALQGVSAEMQETWHESCVIEECATNGNSVALVVAEEALQECYDAGDC